MVAMRNAKDLASYMREQRITKSVSQKDLASRIGKSRRWVIDFENGKTMPSLPAVIDAAQALGLVIDISPIGDEEAELNEVFRRLQ